MAIIIDKQTNWTAYTCTKLIMTLYYDNQEDLWDALTEAAQGQDVLAENQTLAEIMDSWTLQSGYPVVSAFR